MTGHGVPPGVDVASVPQEVHRRRPGTPGVRTRRTWPRATAGPEVAPATLSTGVVADAMHRLGAMDAGIAPVWPHARVLGPAVTVWVRAGDKALVHEAIGLAAAGDVLVVNAQGSRAHAVFGELMAMACLSRGIAGIVVDGVIRDAAALAELRFPAFSRGACPSGPLKDGTGEIGYPIACGGVVCAAGDLVLADDDGVVVVPAADADVVLAQAARIRAWEDDRRAALFPTAAATSVPRP